MARPRSENPRSVLLALRVTPRMRFGLELLAQRDRCSMSEVVLRAIDARFEDAALGLQLVAKGERKFSSVLERAWSPHEHERVVRLGVWFPQLLDTEQAHLWRLVCETPRYWELGSTSKRRRICDVRWELLAKDWPGLKRECPA